MGIGVLVLVVIVFKGNLWRECDSSTEVKIDSAPDRIMCTPLTVVTGVCIIIIDPFAPSPDTGRELESRKSLTKSDFRKQKQH